MINGIIQEENTMKYYSFRKKVIALIERAKMPASTNVKFSEEDGKYYARISDGTTIIGNSESLKVSVCWGSGHQALATI